MGTMEKVLDYFTREYKMSSGTRTTQSFENICQHGGIEKAKAISALEELQKQGLVEMGRDSSWSLTAAGLAEVQKRLAQT